MESNASDADGTCDGREYDYIDAIADGIIAGRFTQKEAETLNEARHQGLRNLIISLDRTPAPDTAGGGASSDGERGLEGLGAAAPRVVVSDPATGGRFLGEGSESTVFQDAETGRAIKVRKIPGAERAALREQLDALVRHNALFPKDAYDAEIVSHTSDDGRTNYYLRLTQPLVRPLRDANGYTAKPTEEQIVSELMKIRKDWVFHGSIDESPTDTNADSDCVAADRFMAICPDYVVTDFKPGANTFIDEETGDVRFIDPRVLRNSPNAGIVRQYDADDEFDCEHQDYGSAPPTTTPQIGCFGPMILEKGLSSESAPRHGAPSTHATWLKTS